MSLTELSEEQKELFLDLCIHAMMADRTFAEEEKELIERYCVKMRLPEIRFTALQEFDQAADRLLEISSREELSLIAEEIAGLIVSDHHCDEVEERFAWRLADRLKIKRTEFSQLLQKNLKPV